MKNVRKSLSLRILVNLIVKARKLRDQTIQIKDSALSTLARSCIVHQRIQAAKEDHFAKNYHVFRGDR